MIFFLNEIEFLVTCVSIHVFYNYVECAHDFKSTVLWEMPPLKLRKK